MCLNKIGYIRKCYLPKGSIRCWKLFERKVIGRRVGPRSVFNGWCYGGPYMFGKTYTERPPFFRIASDQMRGGSYRHYPGGFHAYATKKGAMDCLSGSSLSGSSRKDFIAMVTLSDIVATGTQGGFVVHVGRTMRIHKISR